MSQQATLGRIVHYKLGDFDAEQINRRRGDYQAEMARTHIPGTVRVGTGEQCHVGNKVAKGDVFPAMVVRRWGDAPTSCIQLQVFLDGNDTFWATSVNEGDGERQWSWPPRN